MKLNMKPAINALIILIFTAATSFAASQQTSSTTGTQIITKARYYLNASTIWTDAELLEWINDGVVDIAARSRCTETKQAITLAANTLEYSITINYIAISAVVYSPASGALTGLLRGHPNHVGRSDADTMMESVKQPQYWYDWKGDIGIYPPRNTAITGETVYLYAVARPSDLTATTSLVTVPAIYDRALTMYVVGQAFMKMDQWAKSARFMAEYYAEIDRYRQDYVDLPRQQRKEVE